MMELAENMKFTCTTRFARSANELRSTGKMELGSRDGASTVDEASCHLMELVKIYGASEY